MRRWWGPGLKVSKQLIPHHKIILPWTNGTTQPPGVNDNRSSWEKHCILHWSERHLNGQWPTVDSYDSINSPKFHFEQNKLSIVSGMSFHDNQQFFRFESFRDTRLVPVNKIDSFKENTNYWNMTFLLSILPVEDTLCISWHWKPVSVVGKVAVRNDKISITCAWIL